MSGVILLEPHNDDAALFAAYLACEYRPHIVTVLRSRSQDHMGIYAQEREAESQCAAAALGCTWEQWSFVHDIAPNWQAIREMMMILRAGDAPDLVIAPAHEANGNAQHTCVALIADEVFGAANVKHYLTYTGGQTGVRSVKSTGGIENVPQGDWVVAKLRALAEFPSQIERGPRQHFMQDLREYLA